MYNPQSNLTRYLFTNGGIVRSRGGRVMKTKRKRRKNKRGGRAPIHSTKRYKAVAKQALKNVYRRSKRDVTAELKNFVADARQTPIDFINRTKSRVRNTKRKVKNNAISEAKKVIKSEVKRIILREIFG